MEFCIFYNIRKFGYIGDINALLKAKNYKTYLIGITPIFSFCNPPVEYDESDVNLYNKSLRRLVVLSQSRCELDEKPPVTYMYKPPVIYDLKYIVDTLARIYTDVLTDVLKKSAVIFEMLLYIANQMFINIYIKKVGKAFDEKTITHNNKTYNNFTLLLRTLVYKIDNPIQKDQTLDTFVNKVYVENPYTLEKIPIDPGKKELIISNAADMFLSFAKYIDSNTLLQVTDEPIYDYVIANLVRNYIEYTVNIILITNEDIPMYRTMVIYMCIRYVLDNASETYANTIKKHNYKYPNQRYHSNHNTVLYWFKVLNHISVNEIIIPSVEQDDRINTHGLTILRIIDSKSKTTKLNSNVIDDICVNYFRVNTNIPADEQVIILYIALCYGLYAIWNNIIHGYPHSLNTPEKTHINRAKNAYEICINHHIVQEII
jgi:hypothetical protein